MAALVTFGLGSFSTAKKLLTLGFLPAAPVSSNLAAWLSLGSPMFMAMPEPNVSTVSAMWRYVGLYPFALPGSGAGAARWIALKIGLGL